MVSDYSMGLYWIILSDIFYDGQINLFKNMACNLDDYMPDNN